MSPALHAEWTKLRTIASPLWLLIGVVAATVALGAAATSVVDCTATGCGGDTTKLTLTGVYIAKALILTGVVAVGGALGVLGSVLAGRLFLPGVGDRALDLTDGTVLRAVVGTVLYLMLIGLLSLGVATAVRDSATGIGVVLALLYILPIISQTISDPEWQRRLEKVAPMSAGLAIQATTDLATLPISPWAGLGVTAGWAAAALALGGLLLWRRDA